jgi:hypothetical protein
VISVDVPQLESPPIWRRVFRLPGSKKLLNRLAKTALELGDIILSSIPGAEAAHEVKEFIEVSIKAEK